MDNRSSFAAPVPGMYEDQRSIGDILKDIGASLQQIIRSEIQLAKVEVTESARGARSAALMLATGGLFGLYALGFLLLTLMFALETVLPNWLAALIVGVLLLSAASIGISRGRQRMKAIRPPQNTLQTVKEDLQWMKEQPRL